MEEVTDAISQTAVEAIELKNRIAYWDKLAEWGWTFWFAAFACAAVVMVCCALLPRDESNVLVAGTWDRLRQVLARGRRHLIQLACAALLILLCVSQQTGIDQNRGFIADQEVRYERNIAKLREKLGKDEALKTEYLYLPAGNSLAYISLGNTSIAADYVWLTSLQYVSNATRRGQKFELLYRFYIAMLDLDPHWIEAQVNAGKVLSALEPDRDLVEDFYIKCFQQNPDGYRLPYEAARLYVVPPFSEEIQKIYSGKAAFWFQRAMSKKDFPANSRAQVNYWIGLMTKESRNYEASEQILFENATNTQNPAALREFSARDFINTHSLALASLLQDRAQEMKKAHGAWPRSLDELIAGLPGDPKQYKIDSFNLPIEYDPATGEVVSRGHCARAAIQCRSVVQTLLALYSGEHDGKFPDKLEELDAWTRQYYSGPSNPPSVAIRDAIGEDLKPSRSPLRQPWDYDSKTGKVKLPSYCDAQALYQNVQAVMRGEILPFGWEKKKK